MPAAADPTDLSDVPLLTALPEEARHRLERAARVVEVPAGALLLREGDPPGSAFVVRRGRLEVEVGGRVVRELGSGEVIGEIALLTGERRSAAVRARRDSTVIEIPRDAFESMLDRDPAASRIVLRQVADRLRTAGSPPGPPPPERLGVVSVVGLTEAARVPEVAEELVRRMSGHVSVVAPGVVEPAGLARAERDHDRVVLVSEAPRRAADAPWRDVCVRQADAVVLVARSDSPVPQVPFELAPASRPELVLVGPAPTHELRAAWVAATDARQLTLVDGDLAVGLRALADRLAGRSLGLVLAGGGARAFSHIGVLRELEDAGLHVDRVAGSSIGAVIAALHATGMDGATLEERCYAEWVRRRPFSDWRLPTTSLAKGHRVRSAMVRNLGADSVIEGLPRQLQVVSVDLVSRTRQVHRRGSVVDAALASARLPVLFAPLPQDDGRLLVDGGVLDNLPTDLLVQRDEGPVVAVNIGAGSGKRHTGPPRVPALGDTLMRTMMIGSGGAVESARSRGAWVLSPSSMGVGLLEFHQLDRMIEAGRAAARVLLEEAGDDLGVVARDQPAERGARVEVGSGR